jgi:hypothetical protein
MKFRSRDVKAAYVLRQKVVTGVTDMYDYFACSTVWIRKGGGVAICKQRGAYPPHLLYCLLFRTGVYKCT